jgi:hypothetical protein
MENLSPGTVRKSYPSLDSVSKKLDGLGDRPYSLIMNSLKVPFI